MSTSFQIITDGRVYLYNRKMFHFEAALKKPRALLQGKSRASTFDALHKGISENWLIRDDVVRPFGDRRQNLRQVCTFDLDRDLLLFSDESGHIQLPLARLREPGSDPIQRSEFTSFETTPPPKQNLASFPPPYQRATIPVSKRRLDLCSRVLLDFAHQWRHILRASYAESTFRRLARAIISIATCDFRIDELSTRQHIYGTGYYVDVNSLPSWEPCKSTVFNVEGVTVIVHQDLQAAIRIAEDEMRASWKNSTPGDRVEQHMYLLLSVRHILLCRIDSTGTSSYTAPESLMNGLELPSPSAINLLLRALSPSRPLSRTPVGKLPLEIQDQILQQVSEGPVEAARVGCLLSVGSPFVWNRRIDSPRQGGPIELLPTDSHRHVTTPVESRICFGDIFSGVSYR